METFMVAWPLIMGSGSCPGGLPVKGMKCYDSQVSGLCLVYKYHCQGFTSKFPPGAPKATDSGAMAKLLTESGFECS